MIHNSKPAKKNDCYIPQAKSYSDIHSNRKKITPKIQISIRSSPKPISPKRYDTQATIKNKNQPFKSIFLYQTPTTPEIVSTSTTPSKSRNKLSSDQEQETKSTLQSSLLIKPQKLSFQQDIKHDLKDSEDIQEGISRDYSTRIQPLKRFTSRSQFCSLQYLMGDCKNSVNSICEEGNCLYSGDASGEVRKWTLPEYQTGKVNKMTLPKLSLTQSNNKLYKHKKPVMSVEKVNNSLLSGSSDGIVKLYKNDTQKLARFKPGLRLVKKLTSEKIYIGGSEIEFFDLVSLCSFRNPIDCCKVISSASHSNCTFLTGNEDSSVVLWDIRTPRSINSFSGHKGAVTGVTLSSGFTFLTCSDDCSMKEWDLRTLSEINTRKNNSKMRGILLRNENVITGGEHLTVWTSDSKEDFSFHVGSIKCVCLDVLNGLLFTAGFDSKISCISFAY